MTNGEFNKIILKRQEHQTMQLARKAEEYASSADRMHNFKVAGRGQGITPAQALWGMLWKHIVSVQDAVQQDQKVDDAWINEKIGDCCNYFVLLEGLLRENIETGK